MKTVEPEAGKLGTFSGVFTPSVLTILGIILFLRMGYVVGSAGLGKALIIIGLANMISVLTSMSLSAVATNLKVKGGGDYYLISRTLGVPFGGSIGLVLFLAQSVSIAFYCIGFAEAVASFSSHAGAIDTHLIAFGAVALLFTFAWLGSDWASKFQFGVMALLIAALISFFWGGFSQWDSALLKANWNNAENTMPFWVLFAIFFPAVTGFTQGVSMSGDLKDPGKSLPRGTFLAVGISILVYLTVAFVFSAVLPNSELSANYGAMRTISKYGFLIDAGVIAATLSSAMASFMGAPRILQSLSTDKIFPFLNAFAKGSGPTNNPRRGILLSGAIAIAIISLGQLNLVARIVSMFFLISYGLLNYASYYEAKIASPSFRPRFKWFAPKLSLLGFVICAGTMMAIDINSGIAATAVLFAIYQYLKRTAKNTRWADSSRAFYLQQTRINLLGAHTTPSHDRDWQPRLLVLNQSLPTQEPLLAFATWIDGGAGISVALHLCEGEGLTGRRTRDTIQREQAEFILHKEWPLFPLTVCAPDFSTALQSLVQGMGIGPIQPNTAVLSGLSSYSTQSITNEYSQLLKIFTQQGMNIVLFHCQLAQWESLTQTPEDERRIDVWWSKNPTGQLMLMLAYLMTRTKAWSKATIRVLTLGSEQNLDEEKAALEQLLDDVRIDADPFIVDSFDRGKVQEHSATATLVFLPFVRAENNIFDSTGQPIDTTQLPATAFVMAAENLDLDAEPEEGVYALVTEASDALEAAKEKRARAEKTAITAEKNLEALSQKLSDQKQSPETPANPVAHDTLEKELLNAEQESEKARRRLAKEEAKTEEAEKQAADVIEDSILKPTSGDKPSGNGS